MDRQEVIRLTAKDERYTAGYLPDHGFVLLAHNNKHVMTEKATSEQQAQDLLNKFYEGESNE